MPVVPALPVPGILSMRARLHTDAYRLEFQGSPAVWNDLLRPLLGGPEASPDPVIQADGAQGQAPRAAPPQALPREAALRSWSPPAPSPGPSPGPSIATSVPSQGAAWAPSQRPFSASRPSEQRPGDQRTGGHEPEPRTWQRRHGALEPVLAVEPSSDPSTLYSRLATLESRRGERDATLAAVWFLGKGERDVGIDAVEKHLREHGFDGDVKVRPVLHKHVTRTKLVEFGASPNTVRLSPKGVVQARMLIGA
jgi:hypothetical protein